MKFPSRLLFGTFIKPQHKLLSQRFRPATIPSAPEAYGMAGFTDLSFTTAADKTIEFLSDTCDGLADTFPSFFTEVNASGGVLEIETSSGKYVVNKQAPNRQLWLSSPISGPHHYDMIKTDEKSTDAIWKSKKDDRDLIGRLESEFSAIVKKPIAFDD